MEIDLKEMFETSFTKEPPAPGPEVAVAAGRRALRRRRAVIGAAAAAVATVVLLSSAGFREGSRAEPMPSGTPKDETPAEIEQRLTSEMPVDDSWKEDCGRGGQPTCDGYLLGAAIVGFRSDGTVVRISPDVTVIRRTEDSTPVAGGRTVELELRAPARIEVCWWVLSRLPDGTVSATISDPARSKVDFDTWARGINQGKPAQGGPPADPARVLVG